LRSLTVLVSVGLALFAAPATSVLAADMTNLTVSKECSQYAGTVPSFCTIVESSLPALKAGTKVLYYGPVTNNPAFSSNNVILDDGAGSTALGNCIVDFGAGPKGICAFYAGSGALEGFSAIVQVTVDNKSIWHWEGAYALAPAK
jgi:hypothetical protein